MARTRRIRRFLKFEEVVEVAKNEMDVDFFTCELIPEDGRVRIVLWKRRSGINYTIIEIWEAPFRTAETMVDREFGLLIRVPQDNAYPMIF